MTDSKKSEKVKRMTNDKYKAGIGKEVEPLKPKRVEVIDVRIGMQLDKDKREVGEKVTLICQHPDKDKPIEISKVEYRKGKVLKISGLWFKTDDDGMLPFSSALANLLRHFDLACVDDLKGVVVDTTTDEEGYLTVKAY